MYNGLLLRKANEYIDIALEKERAKKYEASREYYIMAAKLMLESAKNADEKIKQIRLLNAEKLMLKAKQLKSNIEIEYNYETNIKPLDEKPKIRFDDIAGLDDVKEKIRDLIITPFFYPEKARKWNIKIGGSILLYGPPGTGKTLLAKAVASELDAKFFYIKASDIMSKWVGESEQRIAELFRTARRDRSIIFIDEIDALLPKRTNNSVMQRIVPQFLTELDGMEDNNNLLLIAATNIPWNLDPAALRSGRFDFKFYIPLPDFAARKKIFELNLSIPNNVDFDLLAQETEGYNGSDIKLICEEAKRLMFKNDINGLDPILTNDDMLYIINNIKPSIDASLLKLYDDYRNAGGGI
ncbi:MAG: hypothetical protein KatS3mg003_1690 [Candidatus Nitrosocaldaceae archaeon]|nr:MAG: hypothetical protein KatS3mg003_1690 [Candidatus Nitrosocaldaceae archaeon]